MNSRFSASTRKPRISPCAAGILVLILFQPAASAQYTDAQLEALETRVGKIYWIAEVNQRMPSILAAPNAAAPTLRLRDNDSFEIVGIARRKDKNPFFKVRLESGKEGYLRPEVFLEEINLTILTTDPLADEKKKAAAAAEDEQRRVRWIRSQPWSDAVKEAAIKRIPVPGLTLDEVKVVLGEPVRVAKGLGVRGTDERWHYADGTILIFHNRLLNRVNLGDKDEP